MGKGARMGCPFFLDTPAAAAKSLQSCPTLCDPRDGSPPGSPIPGILQARTLEWVAISFSNACKWSQSEVAQSCPTLRDHMDYSLSGSSVHGIFQARVLEWGAIAFSCFLTIPSLKYAQPPKILSPVFLMTSSIITPIRNWIKTKYMLIHVCKGILSQERKALPAHMSPGQRWISPHSQFTALWGPCVPYSYLP